MKPETSCAKGIQIMRYWITAVLLFAPIMAQAQSSLKAEN
jgi:hypothetical protein